MVGLGCVDAYSIRWRTILKQNIGCCPLRIPMTLSTESESLRCLSTTKTIQEDALFYVVKFNFKPSFDGNFHDMSVTSYQSNQSRLVHIHLTSQKMSKRHSFVTMSPQTTQKHNFTLNLRRWLVRKCLSFITNLMERPHPAIIFLVFYAGFISWDVTDVFLSMVTSLTQTRETRSRQLILKSRQNFILRLTSSEN